MTAASLRSDESRRPGPADRAVARAALAPPAPPAPRIDARRWPVRLAVPLLALLVGGCAAGPDYRRPPTPLPDRFTEGGVTWERARPDDALPRASWWRDFGDPVLDALMAQLEAGSVDLRAAEARFRQADALGRQARAARWPVLSASAGAARSGGGTVRSASGATVAAGTQNTVSVGASVAWEVDLWGRVARDVEAGEAGTAASAADLVNTRLSLQAALARTYVGLRLAEAQQGLLAATVAAYERSLQLTRDRYAAGVAGRVDVAQAQAQLETTRAQVTDVALQRAQFLHALAVLVGEPASTFQLAARAPSPAEAAPSGTAATGAAAPAGTAPGRTGQPASLAPEGAAAAQADAAALPALPAVAPALPATLLQRRPDVAGAERRVAAANARIGVAQAAFFPVVDLSGSLSQRASGLSGLFDAASRVWSIGPALAVTLFDGGARSAARAQAEAGYDETVAGYRRTVLVALQEVEDALAGLRLLDQEAIATRAAADAAAEALRIATEQYRAGTVSYLNVITAQTAALSSRRTLLELRGRQLSTTVDLIAALGGGWDGRIAVAGEPRAGAAEPATRPAP